MPKSHEIGRIDHWKMGDQNGADPERIEWIKKKHSIEYLELEPGDAAFFHCNLIHFRSISHLVYRHTSK